MGQAKEQLLLGGREITATVHLIPPPPADPAPPTTASFTLLTIMIRSAGITGITVELRCQELRCQELRCRNYGAEITVPVY
jgi:hypothetical protein